jgi:ketosteroid isomerase-like protein
MVCIRCNRQHLERPNIRHVNHDVKPFDHPEAGVIDVREHKRTRTGRDYEQFYIDSGHMLDNQVAETRNPCFLDVVIHYISMHTRIVIPIAVLN